LFLQPIAYVSAQDAGDYIVAEQLASVLSRITPGGVRTVIYAFAAGAWPMRVAIYPGLPRPVGGIVMPANKLEILTPYLALAGLVAAISTVVVIKRRSKD